jgi:amino acid permease
VRLLAYVFATQAFAMGGVINTTCFIVAAGSLSFLSNLIVVVACAHYRQISFQGLVRVALGPQIESAVSVAMVIYCFGTCAGYLNVIGDYSAAVMHEWSTVPDSAPECLFPSEWWCSRIFLMPLLGTVVVLPLALLPTLEALANASFLGICSISLMVGSVGYRGMGSYAEGGKETHSPFFAPFIH